MNYNLRIAIRNLLRQRMGSFINILGFSLSLTVCLLIALYVQYEFSFEQHNEERNNIYRLLAGDKKSVVQSIMYFKPLTENVPELQDATIVYKESERFFMLNNERRIIDEVIFTNTNFLSMFKIKMLKGGNEQLLDLPNAALLSESEAKKLFPNGDAIGKLLTYQNRYEVEVKGIFKDAPVTANYRPHILLNIEAIKTLNEYQYASKYNKSSVFYFRIPGNPDFEAIKEKMNNQGKIAYNYDEFDVKYQFQPLSDIHLYAADTSWDAIKRSDIRTVNVFVIVALLVLVIAVFNFINLSLSLSAKRNFNTGIQKIFGANKSAILRYFLTETSLVMGVCIAVALMLIAFLIPEFNTMMGTRLSFSLLNPVLWLAILGIAFLNILFPSLIQARNKIRLNPVLAVKSKGKIVSKTTKSGYSLVSQSLTVVQIAITIMLIIAVFTMNKQFDLMLNKKLGFDKSNLIAVQNPYGERAIERHGLFTSALEKLSCVENVTATWNSPGIRLNNGDWLLKDGKDSLNLYVMRSPVDAGYFNTMQTQFMLGEPFSEKDSSKLVINETCWKALGVENPIGMTVKRKNDIKGREYQICGVIRDIQNRSLHDETDAAVYYLERFFMVFVIRLSPGDLREGIAQVEAAWNRIEPDYPFKYSFVDDDLQRNYAKEIRTAKLLNMMSGLAILLSMLGLFALSLQVIERKTKEIGIRKVNGAAIKEVLALLNKGFVKWVFVAFVIATPIAYYAMSKWLENFAYKTALSWWIFVLAGGSALAVALLTVSWQSWRAATRNPVEALRYE